MTGIHHLPPDHPVRSYTMHKHILAACLLAGILAPAAADAADRRVIIKNGTSITMTAFQASNTSEDDWEENMLDGRVLEPGQEIIANIDDDSGACLFDFRAQFEGGREATKREVNVCQIEIFTFND